MLRGTLVRGRTSQFLRFVNGRYLSSSSSFVPIANDANQVLKEKTQFKILKEYKFTLRDAVFNLSLVRRPNIEYLNIRCPFYKQKQISIPYQESLEVHIYDPVYNGPIEEFSPVPIAVKLVDRLIRKNRREYLYPVWSLIHNDKRYQDYSLIGRLKIFSQVLDAVQHYPQVDSKLVYELRLYMKSVVVDDGKNVLTKKDVISKVVDVVQSSPIVSQYEVTSTTHFCEDLNLDKDGRRHMIRALQMEFKMHLPGNIDSCEGAIDYIYDNLDERMGLEEFRHEFQYAPKSKSLFRHFF